MSQRKRRRLVVRHFHENGLKFVLENPENIRDLLQLLDVKLVPRIDFSKMHVVPGRFVGRDYRHLECDLVLQAPVRPSGEDTHREIVVYILIEHQSEPDRFMPLRVLEYVVMIYKRQLREAAQKPTDPDGLRLQPVLPIVLYTGTRSWERLGSLRELVALGDELGERIPELQPLFLNVGQTSDDVLKQGGAFGALLRLIQQRRTRLEIFEKTLREVVAMLESLAQNDLERWWELLSYITAMIYNERETGEQDPLVEKVADSAPNETFRREILIMGKTVAEDLIEKGMAKGLQKGLQKGRQEERRRMLLRLLKNKFGKVPAATVKRIEATEQLDILDAWFDQAMAAEKLDDVSFTSA